jgi:hypothetical protein
MMKWIEIEQQGTVMINGEIEQQKILLLLLGAVRVHVVCLLSMWRGFFFCMMYLCMHIMMRTDRGRRWLKLTPDRRTAATVPVTRTVSAWTAGQTAQLLDSVVSFSKSGRPARGRGLVVFPLKNRHVLPFPAKILYLS